MRQEGSQWKAVHTLLLLFCLGVICHRFLNVLPSNWLLVLATVASILLSMWKTRLWFSAFFLIGLCWTNYFASTTLGKYLDSDLEGQDIVIVGTVNNTPVQHEKYARFDFTTETLEYGGQNHQYSLKIRLKAYRNQAEFQEGQKWRLTVRLKRPQGYQNPGGRFNYETYLFQSRIRALGYVRDASSSALLDESNYKFIENFRGEVHKYVQAELGHRQYVGILTALLVGIRGSMENHHWQVLQNTGTIHLVAISGLHIGLVSGLVMWLTGKMWGFTGQWQCFLPARRFAGICGLITAILYALLAGMTIPTQRALVMVIVIVFAGMLRKKLLVSELMILTLSGVLLIDPLSTLASGFWLSFGAVFVIVVCLRLNNTRSTTGVIRTCLRSIVQWIVIQIGLFIGMMPLLITLFGQVSLIAPAANLLAVPVIGLLVVPMALVGLFSFSIGLETVAVQLFSLSLTAIEWVWPVLSFLSTLHWAVWELPNVPWIIMLCSTFGIIIWFSPSAVFPKWLSVVWMLPLLFISSDKLLNQQFRFTMLEVGHGLATVIETRNHALIYDAGPGFPGGLNSGRTIVAPYLHDRGISTINRVVISHPHNDHIGGYWAIDKLFNLEDVITSVPEKIDGSKLCLAGQNWLWDGVRFEVLWPYPLNTYETNNASCVLKISSKYGSLLLTGDIEKEAEQILVKDLRTSLDSDVLQIPHQGSKTSSTPGFVDAVDPTVALLSTGYLNRFSHPHEIVMNRYFERKIPVMNTAYAGALVVTFAENMEIEPFRASLTGYWFY